MRSHAIQEKVMPITLIAKLKSKAGSEAQVEAAFRDMIPKVRANEPGTMAYVLHKGTQDPTTFVFYEVYQDQAALDAHGKTPHMAEMGGRLRGLLDGRPQIDVLTELDRK
jgi:quinol monooxygenase YgiN